MEQIVYNKIILPYKPSFVPLEGALFHETIHRIPGSGPGRLPAAAAVRPHSLYAGGIAVGFLLRTFLDNTFFWPRSWRGLMLGVAGYGIGSNCTPDTFFKLSQETLGILGASLFTLAVSVAVAVYMHRHTFANLLSSIMGCLPGGLTAMTVLMDDYEEADENVVVVSQCLRLFVVEISVPLLAINLFGGQVTRLAGVSLWDASRADFLSLFHPGWLLVVPVVLVGQTLAKKVHMPTGQLLGPIMITALLALWMAGCPGCRPGHGLRPAPYRPVHRHHAGPGKTC